MPGTWVDCSSCARRDNRPIADAQVPGTELPASALLVGPAHALVALVRMVLVLHCSDDLNAIAYRQTGSFCSK